MAKHLIALIAFVVVLITGTLATAHMQPTKGSDQNATVIHKTNPYWPVKGAISIEPCRYRNCTNV